MIIKINQRSEIPLYLQLRNQIVTGIGKGALKPGESLPTVRQLATDLGINSMTVSKAYQLLKAEGFLETDRRRGSVVSLPDANRPGAAAAFEEKLTDELELLTAEAKVHGESVQYDAEKSGGIIRGTGPVGIQWKYMRWSCHT